MNARSAALRGAVAAFCLLAGACTNPYNTQGNYAEPLGSAPVMNNPTPYTDALYCMHEHFEGFGAEPPHMISVGKILDYTGKDDIETGRRLTQGAALMAMSALGKAGIPQVERFDTSVAELEIKFADNQLIGDKEQQGGVRRLVAGQIPGSNFHLIGGITELNYNIRSNEGEVLYDVVSFGARYYVMNIGLDLRLIHTKSLRVVETVSYQKQIIGRELRAGLFEFFDGKLLDLGLGERSLEPIQLAVRSVIERAVFELMRNVHRLPKNACADRLYGPDLHLAGGVGKVEPEGEEQEGEAPKALIPTDETDQVRPS
jgi:curli production assembly/transport component CsgG/holdfast attachment protein HfaB